MSVHRRETGYQVKWRDEDGNQRSRTFKLKGDADTFNDEVKRRKRLGPVLLRELTQSSMTLDGFVRGGFRTHAATRSAKTREQYAWAMNLHLQELAGELLTSLDVPRLEVHQAYLLENGRSVHTVRAVMTMLSGILTVAVRHGLIQGNPVRGVEKPQAEKRDEVRPLSPLQMEAVIAAFTGRDEIVARLAGHGGLRPQEIRKAPWQNLDLDTGDLMIGRARTKRSAARTRTVTLPGVTVHALKQWYLKCGRPPGEEPIVGPLTDKALKQWMFRTGSPLANTVTGRDDITLYTLRHSHASALHYCENYTLPRILRRLGHSSIVHFMHYAHVIDAAENKPHHPTLEAMIADAERAVPVMFPNRDVPAERGR